MSYFSELEAHGGLDPTVEQPEDDRNLFPCACGDPGCVGDGDDKGNIRIGSAWYASDCVMANNHPEVIRARELDAIWDRSRR